MDTYNVGLAGVGVMGNLHAKKLYEIEQKAKLPITFCGVFDVDDSRAKKIASNYHTRKYDTLESLVHDVDAMIIATPTRYHEKNIEYVLSQNTHVLVEKPITHSVESAQNVCSHYNKKELVFMVGHIERFNPCVQELYSFLLKEHESVHTIMVQRVGSFPQRISDVGVVFDMAIHDIDIANYLFNAKPERVYCVAQNRGKSKKHEDYAHIILNYSDARVANIVAHWSTARKIRTLTALNDKRAFQLNYALQELEVLEGLTTTQPPTSWEDFQVASLGLETKTRFGGEPLYREVEHFLDCVVNKKQPLVSAEQATDNLKIAQACLDSAKTQKPRELDWHS